MDRATPDYPGASGGSAIRTVQRTESYRTSTHRILAAGDLNLIYESNASDPQALEERGNGVFQRFKTIGLEMVGPQYPAGRKAAQIPNYLPLRHAERPDVLHQGRVPGNGYPPARLRIRLARLPPTSHGPRPQRSSRLGAKRSLPNTDRGRLIQGSGTAGDVPVDQESDNAVVTATMILRTLPAPCCTSK